MTTEAGMKSDSDPAKVRKHPVFTKPNTEKKPV